MDHELSAASEIMVQNAREAVDELVQSSAHRRVTAAIRTRGFRKFGNYLAARTVKDGGGTWSLGDMADELEINTAIFVSYHTAWIALKKRGLV